MSSAIYPFTIVMSDCLSLTRKIVVVPGLVAGASA
jgi:hypothetical protein